jgi:hypothetical protein
VTIFISYSQDSARVHLLVRALRRHGLRTWRDQDSLEQGAATEDTIEDELERCGTAIVWLGGNTLSSEFVCKNELPLIFQHNDARGMRIVPLFVDVDIETGVDAIRSATGREIGSHNGYRFDQDKPLDEQLTEVAVRETHVHLRQSAQTSAGRRPTVRCVTRSDAAGGRDAADLNLDWIAEYPADGSMPDAGAVSALQAALHSSSQELIANFGQGTTDLFLKCHLHLGVAIGHALRRVTGLLPRVEVAGAWWAITFTPPLPDSRLCENMVNGPAGRNQTSLEISLTRDVRPMVNDYVGATGTTYRRRIHLTPVDGPDQQSVDSDNVNAWAEQAAEAARALRALPGVDVVDVFMAAPIGFAVALGWRLNAVGGIRLFHPAGNAGPYHLAWVLPAS